MTYLLIGGIIAGILQIVGYLYYLNDDKIEPNPITWLMFAYGTAILTLLEWDAKATLPELILPTVCAILAIVVAYKCWIKSKIKNGNYWPKEWWPEDKGERYSFLLDIFITIAYIIVWLFASYALLTFEQKEFAVLIFLFLSNLSTFPSFYPIIMSTYYNPEHEYWVPWFIWGLAYIQLGFITYFTHGSFWHPLMFYPVSNAVMHIAVGVLSLNPKRLI